jgi:hypothetical protein
VKNGAERSALASNRKVKVTIPDAGRHRRAGRGCDKDSLVPRAARPDTK